jgi:alpha-beta hydrolase superfamily lysophospholipase
MTQKTETIMHKDGIKTVLYCYRTSLLPIASILILHGMAEHHKRYEIFVEHLLDQGFDVYLYNHRGHGTDKITKDLGFISTRNGFSLLIHDGIDILDFIKKNGRSNKLYLFGHSMGSLVSRCIIQSYNNLDGVILSGTTNPSKLKVLPGIFLTTIIKKIYGPKHPSRLLDQIIFGSKHYKLLRKRTSFDWLTRNNPVVGAYIHDPYCGFLCSVSFYQDLLRLTLLASNPKKIKNTTKNLPILLISGTHDPVSSMGKEVSTLYKNFTKWKFINSTMKLYPQCRHELLQELNAEEIMNDVVLWIKSNL